jgi:hypothetical protein
VHSVTDYTSQEIVVLSYQIVHHKNFMLAPKNLFVLEIHICALAHQNILSVLTLLRGNPFFELPLLKRFMASQSTERT